MWSHGEAEWLLVVDRFQTTFLGSRAVTGQLVPLGMLDNEDQNGETLADVLYKHGFQGSEEALARTAYLPEQVRQCAPAPFCCLTDLSFGGQHADTTPLQGVQSKPGELRHILNAMQTCAATSQRQQSWEH